MTEPGIDRLATAPAALVGPVKPNSPDRLARTDIGKAVGATLRAACSIDIDAMLKPLQTTATAIERAKAVGASLIRPVEPDVEENATFEIGAKHPRPSASRLS